MKALLARYRAWRLARLQRRLCRAINAAQAWTKLRRLGFTDADKQLTRLYASIDRLERHITHLEGKL